MRDGGGTRRPGGAVLFRSAILTLSFAVIAAAPAPALPQAAAKPAAQEPRFEIRRFVFEGATLVPTRRLEEQTRPFTGPGRTFADVQGALEVVERAYSEAGWSAVQVILPEQELQRGEVRLQVVEAKIGRVLVEGNRFFDDANIRASAPSLAPGKAPNINEISRNLRVANENPAKQTQVLLRSGQEEGTVDAVLRVVDENPSKFSFTMDNSGSPSTGRLRVGLGYQNANLTGNDDALSGVYVTAPYSDHVDESGRPDRYSLVPSRKVQIFGLGYRLPLYQLGDSLDFTFGSSNVNSGTVANIFSITGAGTVLGARYTWNLPKFENYEHRFIFSLDWRSYDNKGIRVTDTATQLIPDVTVHPWGVTYAGAYRQQDMESGWSLGFFKNIGGGNDGGSEDFCKANLRQSGEFCASSRYEIWKWSFYVNQSLPGDFQGRFAMNGQRTKDMLVPGEQFGIGGADSVRGFLEREISDDSGYRGTVELYTPDFGNKTWVEASRMRALVFVDWGHVVKNRALPSETFSQSIASWGFGLRVAQGTNMAFRIDYAFVLDPNDLRAINAHTTNSARLHASFSYIF
jgi:hemolysin activation/secretion protein